MAELATGEACALQEAAAEAAREAAAEAAWEEALEAAAEEAASAATEESAEEAEREEPAPEGEPEAAAQDTAAVAEAELTWKVEAPRAGSLRPPEEKRDDELSVLHEIVYSCDDHTSQAMKRTGVRPGGWPQNTGVRVTKVEKQQEQRGQDQTPCYLLTMICINKDTGESAPWPTGDAEFKAASTIMMRVPCLTQEMVPEGSRNTWYAQHRPQHSTPRGQPTPVPTERERGPPELPGGLFQQAQLNVFSCEFANPARPTIMWMVYEVANSTRSPSIAWGQRSVITYESMRTFSVHARGYISQFQKDQGWAGPDAQHRHNPDEASPEELQRRSRTMMMMIELIRWVIATVVEVFLPQEQEQELVNGSNMEFSHVINVLYLWLTERQIPLLQNPYRDSPDKDWPKGPGDSRATFLRLARALRRKADAFVDLITCYGRLTAKSRRKLCDTKLWGEYNRTIEVRSARLPWRRQHREKLDALRKSKEAARVSAGVSGAHQEGLLDGDGAAAAGGYHAAAAGGYGPSSGAALREGSPEDRGEPPEVRKDEKGEWMDYDGFVRKWGSAAAGQWDGGQMRMGLDGVPYTKAATYKYYCDLGQADSWKYRWKRMKKLEPDEVAKLVPDAARQKQGVAPFPDQPKETRGVALDEFHRAEATLCPYGANRDTLQTYPVRVHLDRCKQQLKVDGNKKVIKDIDEATVTLLHWISQPKEDWEPERLSLPVGVPPVEPAPEQPPKPPKAKRKGYGGHR